MIIGDDYDYNEDDESIKFKFSNKANIQAKGFLNKFSSYGLDGNLKANDIKINLNDYDETKIIESGSEIITKQQEPVDLISTLKPKLLTRYNRLSLLNNFTENDDKLIKYKAYLSNNGYLNNAKEQYPLKKLKLVSYKCLNKQYIPLNESIIKNKLNYIIDLSLFNSRKFRIDWSHALKYSCLCVNNINVQETTSNEDITQHDANIDDAKQIRRSTDLYSTNNQMLVSSLLVQIKQLNMNTSNTSHVLSELDFDIVKMNCIKYLEIQNCNSSKKIDNFNKLPFIKPNIGNKIINEFYNLTMDIQNNIGKLQK